MSRRSTPLSPGGRDGTSQRARQLQALDPGSVAIDERGHAELLAFVQAFTEQLRFLDAPTGAQALREAGTWAVFARRDDLSVADIVAFMRDPERFDGEPARWLGRPHFALLLTFLELLAHARDQLNGLTRRHLEYYYRDVLQMLPEPAVPDRVAVVLRLANHVAQVRLPTGTELQAGRDSAGKPRIYRSERELVVNRARVTDLRSIHVDRRITGLPDVRKARGLPLRDVFESMLALALGTPSPGDPIPPWAGAPVDLAALVGLTTTLRFAPDRLHLPHHELRALMQLVSRRAAADPEWAEINRLLGLHSPPRPRDFAANFKQAVGALDYEVDGLPQVKSLDDLYEHRAEPEVRAYIDQQLAEIGHDDFVALMAIKRRIDAEWAEVGRILEQIGRRQRGLLSWSLPPGDPADFAGNLAAALGADWPPPWPAGTTGIDSYESRLRGLEAHFSMSIERLSSLIAFAERLPPREDPRWSELDLLLADAHHEKARAARRQTLAAARGPHDDLQGFDAVVAAALGQPEDAKTWTDARALLEKHLGRGHLQILDNFRRQLAEPATPRLLTWADAIRVLELAQRFVQALPEPVAQRVEWRNLHAFEDATTALAGDTSRAWKTFGHRPPADEAHPPTATLGWALRAPALALSQGDRKLTLVFGLRALHRPSFLRGLGLAPDERDAEKLRQALVDALRIEATGAKGWLNLELTGAALASGSPGDDYWTLLGVPRQLDEDRPALRLELRAGHTLGPLVPPPDGADAWPTLRVTLRQRWDRGAREWITTFTPFEPLVLASVHLRVEVDGLTSVLLQHEDQALDPNKPFEPFGNRPPVGARLLLWHPELLRPRLDALRLDIEWIGLPDSIKSHYRNYPKIHGAADFKVRVCLFDRNLDVPLVDAPLFREGPGPQALTAAAQSLVIDDVAAALHASSPGHSYDPRPDLAPVRDLRTSERCLVWELTPTDFGHARFPSLTAAKARELVIGLSKGTVDLTQADSFAVEPPYTPTIRRLRVAYRTSLALDPAAPNADAGQLLHVHPFGVSPLDPAEPRLFPRYDSTGELYIGLRELDPPQHLALLLQLAEGTSDPDSEPAQVEWSILGRDRWLALGGDLVVDTTRGLINSGIVELTLPKTAASTLLPAGRTWLRLAVPRNVGSVCDTVDIRAQAALLRFDDRGNAPDHHDRPLPVGSVSRLVEPDPRIAAVEQPFTSFDGRPPERPEHFYTRVSERLRHKQRALTPWDYERLVLGRFRQIYKVKCLPAGATDRPATDLGPGGVDVVVIPDIRDRLPSDVFAPRAQADLLADIQAHLVACAPAAARIRVRNARYVPIIVYLAVRFRPGQDERYAANQLNEDLKRFLSPWAYDDGAELTFGGRIYANSIIDFVDGRDYVDYVADLLLARSADGETFRHVKPVGDDYHVAADEPDQVLVTARSHVITAITKMDYQQSLLTGINYAKLGLDLLVS